VTRYMDVDMDLIRNVDKIRQAYMGFATLSDGHGPLVIESSGCLPNGLQVEEPTVLWHLAEACRKALGEILGDETLGLVCYDAMGDSGESAEYHVQWYWDHMLRKAAEIKHWNRMKVKRGY
jgi:hypothetical protein